MSYQVVNLLVQQGSDFNRKLVFSGLPENSSLLDGYTVRGKIRKKYTDTSALIDFSVDLGTTDCYVSLTAVQTSGLPSNGYSYQITSDFSTRAINRLPEGYYVYDIELVTPAGKVSRVLEGGLIVLPEVTK
jgi:hypothetical protein